MDEYGVNEIFAAIDIARDKDTLDWNYVIGILKKRKDNGRSKGKSNRGNHNKPDRESIRNTYGHPVKRRLDK
jgi:hypothetical protein